MTGIPMVRFMHLTLFVLKTVYFSPVNNPVFYCQLLIAGLLLAGGSLLKHESVVFLLFAAISHRLMPAMHITRPTESRNEVITQAIALLPVKRNIFIGAFLAAGSLYMIVPLSIGFYAGTHREIPPVIYSICPLQMKTISTPSNEPFTFVEGILVSGTWFRVPLSRSLLYGYIASEPMLSNERAPDSVLGKVCPQKAVVMEDIFSGKTIYQSPVVRSPLLDDLKQRNVLHQSLLAVFAFVFFIVDGMRMVLKQPESPAVKRAFRGADGIIYASYLLIWGTLIADAFLPESCIAWIGSHCFLYGSSFYVFVAAAGVLCIIRVAGSTVIVQSGGDR